MTTFNYSQSRISIGTLSISHLDCNSVDSASRLVSLLISHLGRESVSSFPFEIRSTESFLAPIPKFAAHRKETRVGVAASFQSRLGMPLLERCPPLAPFVICILKQFHILHSEKKPANEKAWATSTACLPACLPARLLACLPACQPARLVRLRPPGSSVDSPSFQRTLFGLLVWSQG